MLLREDGFIPEIDRLVEEVLNKVMDPDEFVRRLHAEREQRAQRRQAFVDGLTPEIKAEWINGNPVYHSPARRAHNKVVHQLSMLLGNFNLNKNIMEIAVEKAMLELAINNYEPDICVWQTKNQSFTDDQVVYPACDLVVEVLSKTTEHTDRGQKYKDYAAAGITEYWIIDADKQTLEQFVEANGVYRSHEVYHAKDQVESFLFPAFKFPLQALFDTSAFAKTCRALLG